MITNQQEYGKKRDYTPVKTLCIKNHYAAKLSKTRLLASGQRRYEPVTLNSIDCA